MSPLAAAVAAALLAFCAPAGAAGLGHARVVSAPGQPLKIDVPIVGLDTVEQSTLKVWLADPAAWKQAGLTPPVSLGSMNVRVTYDSGPDSRLVEVSSSQPFDGPVADLLLGVSSAEGEQQYQLSILTQMSGAGAPALAEGPKGAAGSAHGAASHAGAVRVRRGDTMFAIARRNAVPGVTVYQMMIALQRVNPGAFIRHNINLVKAGATLAMPDKAALTAVSDREARRLFMRQVQEFEAYRQRLAGHSLAPAAGASASGGKVSRGENSEQAPASPQDRVVLSSGSSGADRAADQKAAAGKAEADSRQRVTELEQNVHRLDQALNGKGGGEAGVASSGSGSSAGGKAGHAGGIAAPGMAGLGVGAASQSGAAGGQNPGKDSGKSSGSVTAEGAAEGGANAADASKAGASATAKSGSSGSSGSSGTPGSGNGAAATQGSGAGASAPGGRAYAANGGSASGGSAAAGGAASDHSAASSKAPPGSSASGSSDAKPGSAGTGTQNAGGNPANSDKTGKNVTWIQEHMLGVVTALLALIVLIIAWVLRRINAVRDDGGSGARITEAMVQEKLDQINLDLRQPPGDGPAQKKD